MAKKILKVAATIGGGLIGGPLGAIAGAGLGKLIGGKKKKEAAAPAPAPAGPQVMPLPDDAAVLAARKRSLAAQRRRGGRSSTILTTGSDKLGSY